MQTIARIVPACTKTSVRQLILLPRTTSHIINMFPLHIGIDPQNLHIYVVGLADGVWVRVWVRTMGLLLYMCHPQLKSCFKLNLCGLGGRGENQNTVPWPWTAKNKSIACRGYSFKTVAYCGNEACPGYL